MAHVKISETIQSCPRCGKKLLKVTTGAVLIGSPLITCKKCGVTYRTDLRVEWYRFPQKWTIFALPAIIAAVILLMGFLFMVKSEEDILIVILVAFFGFFVGLCFTVRDVIRMLQSKRRMRDAAYLQRLLQFGVISREEYAQLCSQIK